MQGLRQRKSVRISQQTCKMDKAEQRLAFRGLAAAVEDFSVPHDNDATSKSRRKAPQTDTAEAVLPLVDRDSDTSEK